MIASQFNLDQRLADLQQARATEFADAAAGRESTSSLSRIGAILRSFIAGSAAERRSRAAAN